MPSAPGRTRTASSTSPIGTPVDPTPAVVQDALRAAADSPGYPTTIGLPATRQAALDWLSASHGVTGLGLDQVLPVIGSKELIASLAVHLGLGAGDLVVFPELAYPTYAVGAALAGARAVARDSLTSLGPERPALLWLNSPSNPTGRVLPPEHLRKVVDWCRERGTVLVSDECYLECAWDAEPVSVLHPSICGDSRRRAARGALALEALQPGRLPLRVRRRRRAAGGRAARGPQEPRPDDARPAAGRDGRRARRHRPREGAARALRRPAGRAARRRWSRRASGSTTPRRRSTSGPPRDEACWDTVTWLAERGILVAPGDFYGTAGAQHVRVAFTATDERIDAAVARLA